MKKLISISGILAGCGGIIILLLIVFQHNTTPQSDTQKIPAVTEQLVGVGQEHQSDHKIFEEDEKDHYADFSVRIVTKSGTVIESPVGEGVRDMQLAEGVGHHVTTAFPNEDRGNVVLTGHQWYPGDGPGNRIFEDLDHLVEGDLIVVVYDGTEYVYKVFAQKTVTADMVEILEDTEEPQLTVYTCTPRYTSQKRLVYTARLVETKPHR